MAVIIPIETKYNPRGVKTAIRDLDDFKRAVDKAGGGFQGFAKVSGEMMKSVGRSMTNAGKDLSVGVTLPLVGIGVAAVATQAKFETSMKSLQVNAGASAKQMKSLSELALQMGADTVFSAGEAADAMLELSKGGLRVADIQGGALASTMNLAATEGMDLARAAEIVTNGMNQFGLSAKDTARISGTLAAGAVASTAGVEELAGGLKYVGTTANNFGISIEDTVTMLAALNTAGIDATTAGTSLNRMLLGLAGTTKKGASTMKDYNLQFFDAQGQLKPVTEIIAELDKELGGLSDKQRTKVLKDIFGVEGMRAANVFLEDGVKGFEALSAATRRLGVDQELADARMSGTAGALEQLKGSLETAAIVIGQVMAPVVQKIAGYIQGWIDKFQQLSPSTQRFIVIAGVAAAAIGPLLVGLGLVITALGGIVAALGAISAPVIAVVAVIAGLTAAVVYLWNRSEAFRTAVTGIWEQLRSVISEAVNLLKRKLEENREVIEKLREGFANIWRFISTYVIPIIGKLVEGYLKVLVSVLGFVVKAIIEVVGFILKFVGALQDAQAAVGRFAEGIGDGIAKVVSFFRELPGNIKTAIGNAGTMLLQTGKDIALGLWNGLKSSASWLISSVTSWVKSVLPDPIERFLGISSPSKLFEGIGLDTAEGLVQGLEKGKDKVKAKSVELIESALGKVRDAIGEARSFGQSVADSLFDGVDMSKAIDDAEETGMSIVDALNRQANESIAFSYKMQALLDAGLNSTTWEAIKNSSRSQGMKIADAYLSGNTSELIGRSNEAVRAAQKIADDVGTNAALKFKTAGVTSALNVLEGLIEELLPAGKKRKQLMSIMDDLAAALSRKVVIDIGTTGGAIPGGGGGSSTPAQTPTAPSTSNLGWTPAGGGQTLSPGAVANTNPTPTPMVWIPAGGGRLVPATAVANARALGGPVFGGQTYLVGERGPELLQIGRSGQVIPNGAGGVTIQPGAVQVNVNGGDPATVQAAVSQAFDDLVRELRAS